VNDEQRDGRHEIEPWSGEFRAADKEREFRLWAFDEDRSHFRNVVLAIALVYASFFIVDYVAAGLHPNFYWAAAARAAVLVLGIFCFGRLGHVADPISMDHVAILFAVGAELGSFVIFGAIEHGPPELRFDEFLLISEMVMVTGVYLFLPNRFRAQLTIGWASAAVDLALPILLGSTTARRVVSQAMFLALANGLGMLLASRMHRLRRTEYTRLAAARLANASLALQVARREASEHQKDQLFSIIAHDLRSPFNVLLGYSRILADHADEIDAARTRKIGNAIHAQGTRILALLDDLLQWARLQIAGIRFAPSPQNLRDQVRGVLESLGPDASAKGVRLVDATEHCWAAADPAMLATIFRNLIGNAIKFTAAGGQVEVRTRHEGASIRIEVADTGIGIPPERLQGLFEISSDRSTRGTDGERGSGLGLLIARDLIEHHRSRLEVESSPGNGSTFGFCLPQADAAPGRASSRHVLDGQSEMAERKEP
jgi:signal transduction histidine kinase